MTLLELEEVLKGVRDGKELQRRRSELTHSGWISYPTPPNAIAIGYELCHGWEFRVKPTPRQYRLCTTHHVTPYRDTSENCYVGGKSGQCEVITLVEAVK